MPNKTLTDIGAKVFVVIGEAGEYSAREDWVSGVFTSLLDAQKLIEERSALHRQDPKAEEGERFYLVEVPIDRWGSYRL